MRKVGRALAEQQITHAVRVLTQTPEENERDAQEWDAAHPEQVAQREAWQAEEGIWEQARAEGRVERYHVPPPHPMLQRGPIKDHWGRYEERIIGTDKVREFRPDLESK